MRHVLTASVLCLFAAAPLTAGPIVFINEIHYDNTGADAGEAIEIAGPAGTNLSGWSLVLYNGANGLTYDTVGLSGTIPNLANGMGVLSFSRAGIQNGAPDGVALVDNAIVVQFLSYEGAFVAADGPANGLMSVNIGVSEPDTTPVGQSLQLTGIGREYSDFIWAAPQANTFGAVNTSQTFVAPAAASVPEPGTLALFAGVLVLALGACRGQRRSPS